jgi:predicted flap endonuclease-1-like 5' DNA nuclease
MERTLEALKAQAEAHERVETELNARIAELSEAAQAQQAGREAQAGLAERLARESDATRQAEQRIEALTRELESERAAVAAAKAALAEAEAGLEQLQPGGDDADPSELEEENRDLQSEVQKLEGMVRERTEQLNRLRWQQEMQEKQNAVRGGEDKMLVVLNQQLSASREDNRRLLERVHELEERLQQESAGRDDLLRIRGVGPKLVDQLEELGFSSFEQIAALNEADLEDEDHPLHALRGRITKDEWIAQATELSGSR